MYRPVRTSSFRKDIKKIRHSKNKMVIFKNVVDSLIRGKKLPEKYKDHKLQGNLQNCRECHISPDLLLIYRIEGEFIYFIRLGPHSELFNWWSDDVCMLIIPQLFINFGRQSRTIKIAYQEAKKSQIWLEGIVPVTVCVTSLLPWPQLRTSLVYSCFYLWPLLSWAGGN